MLRGWGRCEVGSGLLSSSTPHAHTWWTERSDQWTSVFLGREQGKGTQGHSRLLPTAAFQAGTAPV